MTITCTLLEHKRQKPYTYSLAFHDENGHRVALIDNLEASREQLSDFAEAVNAGDLDEIHLYDVLDDAIAQWRMEAADATLSVRG